MCVCFFFLQLIIATIPDAKHGKSPSIVTEENIKLLFEIQKKVFVLDSSSLVLGFRSLNLLPLDRLYETRNVFSFEFWSVAFVSSAFDMWQKYFYYFNTHLWQVDGIKANYSGSVISLADICVKPLDQDCATQSVIQVDLCLIVCI